MLSSGVPSVMMTASTEATFAASFPSRVVQERRPKADLSGPQNVSEPSGLRVRGRRDARTHCPRERRPAPGGDVLPRPLARMELPYWSTVAPASLGGSMRHWLELGATRLLRHDPRLPRRRRIDGHQRGQRRVLGRLVTVRTRRAGGHSSGRRPRSRTRRWSSIAALPAWHAPSAGRCHESRDPPRKEALCRGYDTSPPNRTFGRLSAFFMPRRTKERALPEWVCP